MGGFFNGGRRKIGVLTLLVACVFMGGWVRSVTTWEVVTVHNFFVFSFDQVITLTYGQDDMGYSYNSAEIPAERRQSFWSYTKIRWKIGLFGVYVGQGNNQNKSNNAFTFALIPYWSIVVPLTMLSAYLILTKPRRPTSAKLIDSVSIEGT